MKLVHNVQKKQHRERSQLGSRQRLGHLEKHADYVKRARDYHGKQATLAYLRGKAGERNADEFYYGMRSRRTGKDGLLVSERLGVEQRELSADQMKLLKSQDLGYVETMRNVEARKIEKLAMGTRFEAGGDQKHTFFVDEREELRNGNGKGKSSASNQGSDAAGASGTGAGVAVSHLKQLRKLKGHIERQHQLDRVRDHLVNQKNGMANGSKKKVASSEGVTHFKFRKQRKR